MKHKKRAIKESEMSPKPEFIVKEYYTEDVFENITPEQALLAGEKFKVRIKYIYKEGYSATYDTPGEPDRADLEDIEVLDNTFIRRVAKVLGESESDINDTIYEFVERLFLDEYEEEIVEKHKEDDEWRRINSEEDRINRIKNEGVSNITLGNIVEATVNSVGKLIENGYDIYDDEEDNTEEDNEDYDPWMNGDASWLNGKCKVGNYSVEIDTSLGFVAIENPRNEEDCYFFQGAEADDVIKEMCVMWNQSPDETKQDIIAKWINLYL